MGKLGVVLGALGATAGLMLAGAALLRTGSPGVERRVEMWAFWCMAATALVCGYTSFEVLYRDATSRRLDILPVDPSALYRWKLMEVYRRHLPLILLPAASGVPLLLVGDHGGWIRGVGSTGAVLVWGLGAAVYAHVWAGQSLLEGGSRLKGYMAQGFGPPETAFLFYSPAIALTAAISIGLLADLAIGTGIQRGIWGPLQVVAAGLTVAVLLGLRGAGATFRQSHHLISPRFEDAEVLPPWREGELPRRYFGEDLGRLLPEALRPLWRRDLVQYRRRFRIMPPLLVLSAIALIAYALSTSDSAGGATRVALVTIVVGVVVFSPVFRVCGPELGTRFDARALPVRGADERRVQWLLAASEWGPLALVATLASLLAGFGLGALGVLAAVSLAFVVTQAIVIPRALEASPELGALAFGAKGGLVLLASLCATLIQWVFP